MKRILPIFLLAGSAFAQTTGAPLNLNLPVQGSNGWGDKLNQNSVAINTFAGTVPAFPGSNGIVYRTAATTSRIATFSDIVGMWTSCTSGALQFDGTCSAGGSITSVFGRSGPAITAQTGDYNFAQISGTAVATQLPLPTAAATCVLTAGLPIGSDTNGKLCLGQPTTGVDLAGHDSSGNYTVYTPNTTSTTTGIALVSGKINGVAFVASGASHAQGMVPDPGSTAGTTRYLREDGTWVAPAGSGTVTSVAVTVPSWAGVTGSPITSAGTIAITLPAFVASGASHAPGIVPDPGATAGTTHFLREDGTWAVPAGGGSGTPGGTNGQLQYNNAGAFGGDVVTTDGAGNWSGLASLTVTGSGGSVLASGLIDGHTPTETTTATGVSVGTSTSGPCSPNACLGEYIFNNASGTTTYTLPVAEAGRQYCFRNVTGKSNIIVIQTSGSGQFIDNQGANTTSGGNITSTGALGDSACVVGVSATQWYSLIQSGTWSTN